MFKIGKQKLHKIARFLSACAVCGGLSFYAGQCLYRIQEARKEREATATVISREAYSISRDNKITFIDGIVIRCEDAETANAASMRMDYVIERLPKESTYNDKARRAREYLQPEINDGILYRQEMGLPPQKIRKCIR